jgi:hypothetical protein
MINTEFLDVIVFPLPPDMIFGKISRSPDIITRVIKKIWLRRKSNDKSFKIEKYYLLVVVKFTTGIIIDDLNIKTTIIITQCKITR